MRYHCFWTNPYGLRACSHSTDDLAYVLELVKKNHLPDDEGSDVRGLVVVDGTRLTFEPAVVVHTYRVKPAP